MARHFEQFQHVDYRSMRRHNKHLFATKMPYAALLLLQPFSASGWLKLSWAVVGWEANCIWQKVVTMVCMQSVCVAKSDLKWYVLIQDTRELIQVGALQSEGKLSSTIGLTSATSKSLHVCFGTAPNSHSRSNCPRHTAKSMVVLARQGQATMGQWQTATNPRWESKRSPGCQVWKGPASDC